MGIPLVAGREIAASDRPKSEPVIMINETMARTLWPGQNAIGQKMLACGERTVVGIVKDVHHLAVEQPAGLEMYLPMRQCQDYSSVDLVVRTTLPPSELAASVRTALKPVAPDVTGKDFRTLQELVDKAVSPKRFVALFLGGFALFALLLASLGIYGVVSYGVNQRTQEIGIRMALGASASSVQAHILVQTFGLAAAGMFIGLFASLAAVRVLKGLLFGVTSTDPLTFVGMPLLLVLVAAAAGYAPARRASRIDPAVALRAS
jgi:predicted permease